MQYDTLGHVISNAEPNTSHGDSVWRYVYDDLGDLVGTSDARGCGENLAYDGFGRVISEDYAPCGAPSQVPYTPLSANGDGSETFYTYESILGLGQTGRLQNVKDRAASTTMAYDARGRVTSISRAVAKPGIPSRTLGSRYGATKYSVAFGYDDSNNVTSQTTGATVPQLMAPTTAGAAIGPSTVTASYSPRGFLTTVGGSYGPLVTRVEHEIDGRTDSVTYGDFAGTVASYSYDARLRTKEYKISRAAGAFPHATGSYAPPASGAPNTLQTVLVDDVIAPHGAGPNYAAGPGYDNVNNALSIQDLRIPSEWGPTNMPVTLREFSFDDSYRLLATTSSFAGGSDGFSPPMADPSASVSPMPLLAPANRVTQQSFTYDGLGNTLTSTDDSQVFFDRSLGTISNGPAAGPNQLISATGSAGDLTAQYDYAGNMVQLAVERNGTCTSAAGCNQLFEYDWDEVGHLARARRFDFVGGSTCHKVGLLITCTVSPSPANFPYPSLPATNPSTDVSYAYDASGRRVLRTAGHQVGGSATGSPEITDSYSVEVFPSLRLDDTSWDGTEYVADAITEDVYLTLGALSLGHVVSDPDNPTLYTSGGSTLPQAAYQHVFLEMRDRLSSTTAVIDKATSELVERAAYTSYGSLDSDYRPARWGRFSESYKFSGKEQDAELGIAYFGARYYSAQLGRWLSPDPLTIHSLGADLNPYAYVSGRPTEFVDANGLEGQAQDPTPVCVGVCLTGGGTGGSGGGGGNANGGGPAAHAGEYDTAGGAGNDAPGRVGMAAIYVPNVDKELPEKRLQEVVRGSRRSRQLKSGNLGRIVAPPEAPLVEVLESFFPDMPMFATTGGKILR